MVARLARGTNITSALQYNERKVARGKAECLYAHQFIIPANELNFHAKQKTFDKYNSLNQRTHINTVNISLNFHPQEKLASEKLITIARFYMKAIGFDDQPYLVYQHHDSGHPHLHIVSTTIGSDGTRIDTHNLVLRLGEKTRQAVEAHFNLYRAQGPPAWTLTSAVQTLQYGSAPTKASLQRVLDEVLPQYSYTSLEELNAVLRQYNVIADNGSPTSLVRKYGGLLYRMLDDNGRPMGVAIKASLFNNKPTLASLHKRFIANQAFQQNGVNRLSVLLLSALLRHPSADRQTFSKTLHAHGIALMVIGARKSRPQQIFFIDNRSKTVISENILRSATDELDGKISLILHRLQASSSAAAADQDVPAFIKQQMRRKKKKKLQHPM